MKGNDDECNNGFRNASCGSGGMRAALVRLLLRERRVARQFGGFDQLRNSSRDLPKTDPDTYLMAKHKSRMSSNGGNRCWLNLKRN